MGWAGRFSNRVRILFLNPLARRSPLRTLWLWGRWSLAARRDTAAVVVPYVDDTRIRVAVRNREARAYAYLALVEVEDMGFVLHAVGADDLFVDVGAYIGGYTLIAAGACGARAIAVEPDPDNRRDLQHNLELNQLTSRVDVVASAVGDARPTVAMTPNAGSTARVLERAGDASFEVEMITLDDVVGDRLPSFLKIDVEGFESRVLAGGRRTLSAPTLLAVVMELNASGGAYRETDASVHEAMLRFGFHSYRYDPWRRSLESLGDRQNLQAGNTIYLRDPVAIERRLKASPRRRVHGTRL
jgi:FkbM family methyltransferase